MVALGVGLRARQWAVDRAFWLDELLLLRAMRAQRADALLAPLPYDQSAPPGWLAVQHVVVGLSGADERAARLLPLLFGCGGLVLAAALARTVLGGPAALAATALAAVSPALVLHSTEFKQYSSDLFWAALVVLLGCRLALRRGRAARGWPALGAAAAVGVWFSHAAVLAGAGVLAGLGLLALARRRRRDLARLAACAVPFAAGVLVEYVLVLRRNAGNDVLQAYWAFGLPPEPVRFGGFLGWLGQRWPELTVDPLGVGHPAVVLTLLVAGLATLGLRRSAALPVLVLPVAVTLVVVAARSYPLASRLVLFLLPVVLVLLAAPLDLPALAAGVPRRPARVAALAGAGGVAAAAAAGLLVLVTPNVQLAWQRLGEPRRQEESRSVLEYLAAHRRPGDLVLVDGRGARFGAAFYGPRVGLGPYRLLEPAGRDCPPAWLGGTLRAEGRYPRVWLVSSHTRAGDLVTYHAHLDRFGRPVETFSAPGAEVTRYDRSTGPVRPASPPPQGCLLVRDPAGDG